MLILFDIDATLVDHDAAFRVGTRALHRASGIDLDEAEFHARWLAAQARHFDRFLRAEVSHAEHRRLRVRDTLGADLADDVLEQLFAVYMEAYENAWTPFADVERCLDALRGHRLGVISNGQSAQQRRKLERVGLAPRFEHVTISEDCGAPKPDARIFLHACERCGVEPHEVLYVGDRYDLDAEGARAAGLTGVWLDRARSATSDHTPPIIGSLDELPSLVATLASGRTAPEPR